MILDLTDVCSCENKELTKEAVIELTSFDSKLGVFPFIEKGFTDSRRNGRKDSNTM